MEEDSSAFATFIKLLKAVVTTIPFDSIFVSFSFLLFYLLEYEECSSSICLNFRKNLNFLTSKWSIIFLKNWVSKN